MEHPIHDEPPRILVVDDEKVIREILADFLSMEGFWVRTAEDGGAALVELSRGRYDLVLSDLKFLNSHLAGCIAGCRFCRPAGQVPIKPFKILNFRCLE